MVKLIVSTRMAGKHTESALAESHDNLNSALESMSLFSDTLVDRTPTPKTRRRTLFLDGDMDEFRAKAHGFSADVLIEPHLLRTTAVAHPLPLVRMRTPLDAIPLSTSASSPDRVGTLGFAVHGEGVPVPAAKVELFLVDASHQSTTMSSSSDGSGAVEFQYDASAWTPIYAMITPLGSYWSTIAVQPANGSVVQLTSLPKAGPLGWWHQVAGMSSYSEQHGQGIRVGVVDTGVGPNAALSHVRSVGAFLNGVHDTSPSAGLDARDHGTHVSGIIGARPATGSGQYGGLAPGADVMVARVFTETEDTNQGDIAHAIEHLSEVERADLINLSLGGGVSRIEADAFMAAAENGTLSLCAAGNNAGAVMFPAALRETVAVSAIGLSGTTPPHTLDSMNEPTTAEYKGTDGFFLASFSNHGVEINSTGPGVGIISTVPAFGGESAPYAAMSGTSMACPVATGALASLLSLDETYLALPRDMRRAARASTVQAATARSIGLGRTLQGIGLVRSAP